jgi:hypothetical protein
MDTEPSHSDARIATRGCTYPPGLALGSIDAQPRGACQLFSGRHSSNRPDASRIISSVYGLGCRKGVYRGREGFRRVTSLETHTLDHTLSPHDMSLAALPVAHRPRRVSWCRAPPSPREAAPHAHPPSSKHSSKLCQTRRHFGELLTGGAPAEALVSGTAKSTCGPSCPSTLPEILLLYEISAGFSANYLPVARRLRRVLWCRAPPSPRAGPHARPLSPGAPPPPNAPAGPAHGTEEEGKESQSRHMK